MNDSRPLKIYSQLTRVIFTSRQQTVWRVKWVTWRVPSRGCRMRSLCFCWKVSEVTWIPLNRDLSQHYWPEYINFKVAWQLWQPCRLWIDGIKLWSGIGPNWSLGSHTFSSNVFAIFHTWIIDQCVNSGVTDQCLDIWNTNKLAKFLRIFSNNFWFFLSLLSLSSCVIYNWSYERWRQNN